MSLVWGDNNRDFLTKRHSALTKYRMFSSMNYSESHDEIADWIPLMMKGRDPKETISATRMAIGTDVNFGAITRAMVSYLETCDAVDLYLGHDVLDLKEIENGWLIEVKDNALGKEKAHSADFVFIGAGGGAIKLLEKSDIPESRGYAGFPISGQFLQCTNPEIVQHHEAKVYGKAETGSPPMSVPHLDTRIMSGVRSLLFGPYAGFSTKFLKNGSFFDLPLSLEVHNVWPLLSAGIHNLELTKYLISQVTMSEEVRFAFLKKYYPEARMEDWKLIKAGQRVQIIKKDEKEGGVLKFGTEIVTDKKKTLAALLGASPGASTSVSIMLDLLENCFPEEMKTQKWKNKITEMIPSYGQSLIQNSELCMSTRNRTTSILKLN